MDNEAVVTLHLQPSALALVLWSYFIAIHRRFWRMSLCLARACSTSVAAIASYQAEFLAHVRRRAYWTTHKTLIGAGLVKV